MLGAISENMYCLGGRHAIIRKTCSYRKADEKNIDMMLLNNNKKQAIFTKFKFDRNKYLGS